MVSVLKGTLLSSSTTRKVLTTPATCCETVVTLPLIQAPLYFVGNWERGASWSGRETKEGPLGMRQVKEYLQPRPQGLLHNRRGDPGDEVGNN